jgi:hypothetical protein
MPENHQPAVQQATPAAREAFGVLSVVGSALFGAFIGAIAGYKFLPHLLSYEKAKALGALVGLRLVPANMSWLPASLGAAVGFIVGTVAGRSTRAREDRRTSDFRQAAASLGGQFSPSSDPGLIEKLTRFFPERSSADMLRVQNVIRTQVQGARIAVGDVSYLIRTASATPTSHSTGTVRQTVVYHESDTVQFPKFTLQPESHLLDLFAGAVGIQGIDFPAHPEFSRAYHLTGVHPEHARRLFDDGPLLEGLRRRQGLHVESDLGGLVIYRSNKLCEAGELKDFVSEAAEIFRLFEDSARKSGAAAETVLTPEAEIRTLAATTPGLMGYFLRKTLVTRADMDAFIRQPPPRTIPANILRYRDKFVPGFVMFAGMGLAIAGAAFALFGYVALSDGRGLMRAKGAAVILPLVFLGAGGCIAYFAGRTRNRAKRLLRNGRTCAAMIEKIDPTGESLNKASVSLLTVQFQADGRVVQASCRIVGEAVERAQQFAVDKKPVPILYDPADPRRILFVEALLNVSREYEK